MGRVMQILFAKLNIVIRLIISQTKITFDTIMNMIFVSNFLIIRTPFLG